MKRAEIPRLIRRAQGLQGSLKRKSARNGARGLGGFMLFKGSDIVWAFFNFHGRCCKFDVLPMAKAR